MQIDERIYPMKTHRIDPDDPMSWPYKDVQVCVNLGGQVPVAARITGGYSPSWLVKTRVSKKRIQYREVSISETDTWFYPYSASEIPEAADVRTKQKSAEFDRRIANVRQDYFYGDDTPVDVENFHERATKLDINDPDTWPEDISEVYVHEAGVKSGPYKAKAEHWSPSTNAGYVPTMHWRFGEGVGWNRVAQNGDLWVYANPKASVAKRKVSVSGIEELSPIQVERIKEAFDLYKHRGVPDYVLEEDDEDKKVTIAWHSDAKCVSFTHKAYQYFTDALFLELVYNPKTSCF
jgi:hypothetical protein